MRAILCVLLHKRGADSDPSSSAERLAGETAPDARRTPHGGVCGYHSADHASIHACKHACKHMSAQACRLCGSTPHTSRVAPLRPALMGMGAVAGTCDIQWSEWQQAH